MRLISLSERAKRIDFGARAAFGTPVATRTLVGAVLGVAGIALLLTVAQCVSNIDRGDTLVMVVGERAVARCDDWRAAGWRYTTVQIRDCVAEHAGVLARGGEEGVTCSARINC